MDMNNITWTCHICGETRPDDKISVKTHDLVFPGLPAGTAKNNVRYCNDKEHCRNEAEKGPRVQIPK